MNLFIISPLGHVQVPVCVQTIGRHNFTQICMSSLQKLDPSNDWKGWEVFKRKQPPKHSVGMRQETAETAEHGPTQMHQPDKPKLS